MDKNTAEKLHNFFSKYKSISFKKGESILRPGNELSGILYIMEGYSRLYSISKDAQELTLIIFKTEDFFPMTWAIKNTSNSYYMEAMTNVKLVKVPREQFLKFIQDNNKLMFEILSRISIRFEGLLQRMEYAIFGNAESKVASIILICADRFGLKTKDGIIIRVPLTHQDIAKLIGMARETVSIEMKKLQKRRLVNHKGKYLIVKNYQKLKEESTLGQ